MSTEPIQRVQPPQPGAVAQAPIATGASVPTPVQSTNAAALDSVTPPLKDLRPDYVLEVPLAETKEQDQKTSQQVEQLIDLLSTNGFFVQVVPGATATVLSPGSIFILVRLAQVTLIDQHLISSVQDYTNGVQKLLPNGEGLSAEIFDSRITPADRLRLIYSRLTDTTSGLGITPKIGKWAFVSQIFAIQDSGLNDKWLSNWTRKLIIDSSDIAWVRSQFGERVGMYFAYLQHYFFWLSVPATVGLFVHLFVGAFSLTFTIFNVVWAVLFFYSWSLRQNSLALKWGTKGVSSIETPRPEFQPEQWVRDPITNKAVPTASYWTRTVKQLATIPMILSAAGAVVLLQTFALSLEIFFTQAYTGPLAFAFKFAPTVVLAAVIPVVIAIYSMVVSKVISWENHATKNSFATSFNQKLFAVSLLVSTGNLLLTAFVYLPFGHNILPHLTFLTQYLNRLVGTTIADPKGFIINGSRLQGQVLYMMVTAQIIAFVTENFLPTIIRKVTAKVQEYRTGEVSKINTTHVTPDDIFLAELREQAPLSTFNVDAEYQKMIIQLAFVVIFGSVWPLAALASFLNNFIELRADARKIVIDSQRPIPEREEDIGKYWLSDISLVTWAAAVIGPVISVMYGTCGHTIDNLMIENLNRLTVRTSSYLGDEKFGGFEPTAAKVNNSFGSAHVHAPPRTILLALLLSEHSYFLFKGFANYVYKKLAYDSNENIAEAKEEHEMRREVVELQLKGDNRALQLVESSIKFDRNADKVQTPAPSNTGSEKNTEAVELDKLASMPESTNVENIEQFLARENADQPAPESIEKMWMEIKVSAQTQAQSVIKNQLDTHVQKQQKKAFEEKEKAKTTVKKD